MKKYMVETVNIFRHRYVVEAKEPGHATDEVVMQMRNDGFKEFSQYHVDEVVSSVREIDDREYLRLFDTDNAYLGNWTDEQKFAFVNRIDYNGGASQELNALCGDSECCGICNPKKDEIKNLSVEQLTDIHGPI